MTIDLTEATAILGRTPATLRSLLDGVPNAWLGATEGEDTFSPADVVGHLIHGEKTDWIPRLRLILESGESRPFEPFDRFGFQEEIHGRPMSSLLDELESLRSSSLTTLRDLNLTPDRLKLSGRHPELGRVTVSQLLATWVVHDLNHVGQIARVMSKTYSEEVGPWKAYLGILNR